jgi:DNA-binding beta-propeller fold protein YncE
MKLQYNGLIQSCGFLNRWKLAIFMRVRRGKLAKIDLMQRKVTGYLKLAQANDPAPHNMPQDIRSSPDGSVFFVADMEADGVHIIDAASFKLIGFIPTGRGAHGLYPSRDGKKLYVTNRGTHMGETKPKGMGRSSSISRLHKVETNWPIPAAAVRYGQ